VKLPVDHIPYITGLAAIAVYSKAVQFFQPTTRKRMMPHRR
jgi:hypothetical protein